MNDVAVISVSGKRLMPTSRYRARKLLRSGKAEIFRYRPVFTIRLTARTDGKTQPVELCMDAGYLHVGISVKSAKHEYVHRQYDLLPDETERHNDRKKYRRTRRNRLRYRKPRFSNRKGLIAKGNFAPSIRNKMETHIRIAEQFCSVYPVTNIVIETGSFDTQALKAVLEGKPLPEGTDYQHGERYGIETLRAAVFARDGHKCRICGRGVTEGAVLHAHHVGYYKSDRTNRLSNLMSVCERCHTSVNHKPGGKLYGLKPALPSMTAEAFMSAVYKEIFFRLRNALPEVRVHRTDGAMTKTKRHALYLAKTHANDAYAMGNLHPKHRAHQETYRKRRRNNRILEKFYDAKYTDIRDGSVKKGSAIGCNRTKRNILRNNPENLRPFRGHKVSKGRRSIRKTRYAIRPGDIVTVSGRKQSACGMHCNGTRIIMPGNKSVNVKTVTKVIHCGGWERIA